MKKILFLPLITFAILTGTFYYANGQGEAINNKQVQQSFDVFSLNQLGQDIFSASPISAIGEVLSGPRLTEEGVIEWTNWQREQHDKNTLSENDALNEIAKTKLNDMFESQYFEHISPQNGESVGDLARKAGYGYAIVGENLALGNYRDDERLVQAWMDSPGHRDNVLHERYVDIGVAIGRGDFQGRQTWLAVQVFGLPLSYCPDIDNSLEEKIVKNQKEIERFGLLADIKQNEINNLEKKGNRQEMNSKIAEFNDMTNKTNLLVSETKTLVGIFNEQVRKFNDCLSGI
jgi:uncharacterized protein YkwD